MKVKRWGCLFSVVIFFGFLGYSIKETLEAMYLQYGNMTLEPAIVKYMEKHDGRWPSSWDDLQPYYKDLLLPVHTTRFIRKYYSIAWNVNPYEIYEKNKEPPADGAISNYKDDLCTIVYRHSREGPGDDKRRWILTPRIHQFIHDRAQQTPAPR